jgi:NAD(P)H-hydrate epimerase
MKLATAAQMRELDRRAIDDFAIPGLVLMENAGRGAAEVIEEHFGEACAKGVVVLCGPGNNGGDGFVIARHLHNQGFDVECWLIAPGSQLHGDAKTNYRIAEKIGIPVYQLRSEKDHRAAVDALADAGLVVDALFGTGLTRAIEGPAAELIALANGLDAPIVAVDMPSGVNADTGQLTGPAIRADLTCTFGLPKLAQFLFPGAEHCGTIEVVDISLPPELIDAAEIKARLIERDDALPLFAPRDAQAHKGSFGHVLVLGGSRGMGGAPLMAARAAVTSGAGLVTAGVPESLLPAAEAALLEALKAGLAEDSAGRFSAAALGGALELAAGKNVIAVGPGLGRSEALETFVGGLLAATNVPLVIDADGLNNLAANVDLLAGAQAPVVLTPHPGEMARLRKCTTAEVQADRLGAALGLAAATGAVVALKGAHTVVAAPDGRLWINPTGNPGMATGGAGDVLTGLIAGFIAQGAEPLAATLAGVFLHGAAGDRVAAQVGERATTAGGLLAALPAIFKEMEDACAGAGPERDE